MNEHDLFGRIAKQDVISRYVFSIPVQNALEYYSLKRGIFTISRRDTGLAKSMLQERLDIGIKSYLLELYIENQSPSDPLLLEHLCDFPSFSKAIYYSISADVIFKKSHINAESPNYINGLLEVSELSDLTSRGFYVYVQDRFVDKLRNRRIF